VDLGTADGDGTDAAEHHIKAVGWDAPKIGKPKWCFFLNHIFDYIFVGVFCAFVFIYIYVYIVLVFFNHLL
jgi:hypothetical protein